MPHSAVTPALAAELTAARDAAERFATRLLGAERGADTASAAVLVAIERCAAGTPPRDVRRFVLGVVWKKAMGVGRRRAPRPLDEAAATPASAPDPARLAEVREWLTFALAKLDPHERALLHLHYEEGASYEEIATVVGGSVGGVGRKLHDARRRLAQELDRHGAGALVALLPALRRGATSLTAATEAVAAAEAAAVGGQTLAAASVGAWVVGGGAAMWKILCGAALVAAVIWWFARPAAADASGRARTSETPTAGEPSPTLEGAAAAASRGRLVVASAAFEDPDAVARLLRGVVVDEAGVPIGGALVAAEPFPAKVGGGRRLDSCPHSAVTGADGGFAFVGPDAAFVDVRATAAGYAAAFEGGVRPGGEPLRIALTRGRTVRGVVRTAGGEPCAGARVGLETSVWGAVEEVAVRTDAAGRYALTGVAGEGEGRTFRLTASADGYASQVRGAGMRGLADVEDFVLHRGAVWTGVVRAAADGRPIAGAQVVRWTTQAPGGTTLLAGRRVLSALGSRVVARTTTDADGRYRFEHAPVETGDAPFDVSFRTATKRAGGVAAYAPGYAAGGTGVVVSAEDGAVVETDVELPSAATVVGRVEDGLGRPVAGARVYVGDGPLGGQGAHGLVPGEEGPLGGAVRTAEDGTFGHETAAVPRTPGEKARLSVCGCEHGLEPAARKEIDLEAGAVVDVGTIVLGPRALFELRGVVVDEAGAPVAGAAVWGVVGPTVATDSEGRFRAVVAALGNGAAPRSFSTARPLEEQRSGPTLVVSARGYAETRAAVQRDGGELRIVLARAASTSTAPRAVASSDAVAKVVVVAVDAAGARLAERVEAMISATESVPGDTPAFSSVEPRGPGRAEARVRPGRWRVRATAPGRLPGVAEFMIEAADRERVVEVFMAPAATLRGRVTGQAARSASDLRVVAEPVDAPAADRQLWTEVAPNGDYRIDGLAPGRWKAYVGRSNGTALGLAVEIVAPAGAGDLRQDLRTE